MKKYISYLKYPLMVFLVWYLISGGRLDFRALAGFFQGSQALIIIFAVIVLCGTNILFAFRYRIALGAIGHTPKLKTVFSIIMIGVFYSNFLPGGTGGDLMRIYYLKRKENIPISEGSAATLLDRMMAMLGLVFVAIVSLLAVSYVSTSGMVAEVLWGQPIILAVSAFIPIGIVGGLFLLRIPKVYSILEKILSKVVFGNHMISFMKTFQTLALNGKVIAASFGLSIIGHITTISLISLVAYSMYGVSAMYAAIATSGLVILTGIIPVTPGNIGLTEWLADNMFRFFGVEGGANVFAIWRVITVLFSLLGGIVFLYFGGKKGMDEVIKSAETNQ